MSRSCRLSADALDTLMEQEQDARDGIEYTAAELAEYDAFCRRHDSLAATHEALAELHDAAAAMYDAGAELPTDWHADPYADATHDAAGFPLTTEFPW